MANDTKAARTELERGRWSANGLVIHTRVGATIHTRPTQAHDSEVCLCAPCTDARIFARQGVK